jgi:PadR family transcriptional regulator PadR
MWLKFPPAVMRIRYVGVLYMPTPAEQGWKKGSAELLVLSLLENQPRHGYDIARLIDLRSGGSIRFHVASLYPLLYRLEKRDWIQGRWLEKANQRRRRYYSLTAKGILALAEKRRQWQDFSGAIVRITGVEHA